MTTYKARTYRSNDWWAIEITDGLPDNMLGVTQVRRVTEAEQAARNVIADLLEVDPDSVNLELHIDAPTPIKKQQRLLEAAEANLLAARTDAMTIRRQLATEAIEEGLTMREAGVLLGVSHQRVKQLVDDA
jgi:hypothetical protein